MEVKYKFMCAFWGLVLTIFVAGAKVPPNTDAFIQSVEQLSAIRPNEANEASILATRMMGCFTNSSVSQGADINNSEIFLLGLGKEKFSARTYSRLLRKLIFDDKEICSNYKILNSEVIKEPSSRGDIPRNYFTYVQNTVIYKGRSYTFWQRFSEDHEKASSKEIRNRGINSIITQEKPFEKKGVSIDNIIENMTERQLLDLAAEYYTRKKYEEAYNTYVILTQKYDSNAEGWYRRAIMVLKKKGCKFDNHKDVARPMLEKAKSVGASGKILREINDLLYWFVHPKASRG